MHSFTSSSFSIAEYELGNQDDLSSHCALKRTFGFANSSIQALLCYHCFLFFKRRGSERYTSPPVLADLLYIDSYKKQSVER